MSDVTAQAAAAGALDPGRLHDFGDLSELGAHPGITVYKSLGMGWQDLAVAQAAWESCRCPPV